MFYSNWNRGWEFAKGDARIDSLTFSQVDLPHSNTLLPLSYFDEKDFQFVSTYRKRFQIPSKGEQRFLLSFEGFGNRIEAYLNGSPCLSSVYGYTGERVDVTPFVQDGENVLEVILDSKEDPSTPPFGGLLDYLCFGGLYRKSHLEIVPSTYLEGVRITYLGDNQAKIELDKVGEAPLSVETTFSFQDETYTFHLTSPETIVTFPSLHLWSPEEPNLYHVSLSFLGREMSLEYGFRIIELKDKELCINGEPIKLFGLNRHQSYPYIGYASTEGMERDDAQKLYELGLNFVRLSHYPMSEAFLNECDRLGLVVLEEIPGWQHLGDESWQKRGTTYLQKMIQRDYNHPCIVFWGVRINESPDCHDFYVQNNELAKKMDPSRLRAGVRCFKKSELLEDVYSWNDFSFSMDKPVEEPIDVLSNNVDAPILITEFGGHTYPTRKTDNEGRELEQTLRHALIHSAVHEKKGFIGASGWCAFDYNTHHTFGSGDKICYHGVCDIFRQDKMAASFYKGQRDRTRGLFLDCSSSWAFGERNYGGVTPLYIFTNCDAVLFEMEGQPSIYLNQGDPRFVSLPHPVFRIDSLHGAWGLDWKNAKITGYVDGNPVISKTLLADPLPTSLSLVPSSKQIADDDAVYFGVQLLDQAGNPLVRSTDILEITVNNGTLIGPRIVALNGGTYGFYVKANQPGPLSLSVSCRGLNAKQEVAVYAKNSI